MRNGTFLAEEPPERLIARYNAQTLEEVFLRLSIKQNIDYCSDKSHSVINNVMESIIDSNNKPEDYTQFNTNELNYLPDVPHETKHVPKLSDYYPRINGKHIKALVWKAFLWILRNWPAVCFVLSMPLVQLSIIILAIGHDPVDLRVAVTNYETNNTVSCNHTMACYNDELSCVYLGYLEKRALNLVGRNIK